MSSPQAPNGPAAPPVSIAAGAGGASGPSTSTFRPAHAPAYRSASSDGTRKLSLQRTHSRKDYYDADTSRMDGELGLASREDHADGGADLSRMGSAPNLKAPRNKREPVSRTKLSAGTTQHQPRHTLLGRLESYEEADAQERGEEMHELEQVHSGDGVSTTHGHPPQSHGVQGDREADSDATHAAAEQTSDKEKDGLDLEKGGAVVEEKKAESSQGHDGDVDFVTWDSPDSPENPRNWSKQKKWSITLLVSSYTFFSPLSSSMIAPALPTISTQFHISSSVGQNLMLSVFVLGYAFGPLFLAPLSEMFGRRPVIQGANIFFIIWTVACAVSQNQGELTAFRFLSGLGGSAPLAVGAGSLADMFSPQERGYAMAMYSLAPLLGPVVGPIVGGAVTEYIGNWRWIFGIAAIALATPAIVGIIFLQETYAPRILAVKCAKLRKETGNEKLHTVFQVQGDVRWKAKFKHNLVRPFVLLGTQPIVQLLAAYMSVIYGVMYLLLTSFDSIFTRQYGYNTFIASLHYIALGIGFTLGGQIGGRVVDRVYGRLKARNGGRGVPEMKLPFMMISSFLVPIGLILFGFSAQYKVFWLVPDVGAAIFGLGMMGSFLCLQNYTVDAYNVYAASALSAVGLCRSLCGFALPLAAPSLYSNLGYDYGSLLLAGIAALLGIPAPFLFYKYGGWLRARSPYAAGGA